MTTGALVTSVEQIARTLPCDLPASLASVPIMQAKPLRPRGPLLWMGLFFRLQPMNSVTPYRAARAGMTVEARRKAATHQVKTSLQKYSTFQNFGFMA